MISRLLTSGAVKLSTLDGDEMPNWISGCHDKKYYTVLTQLELQRIHEAKCQCEKQKLVAEAAQEEVKQCARKIKSRAVISLAQGISKQNKFTLVMEEKNKSFDDETTPPFIAIQIGKERLPTYAFIDSGANGNTISYELF